MSTYAQVDFTARTNADLVESFQITSGGSPQNLTGATLRMAVADAAGNHVLVPTITVTDAVNGLLTVSVPAARMMTMLPGSYSHDLKMVLAGVTSTLWAGALTVEQGIA